MLHAKKFAGTMVLSVGLGLGTMTSAETLDVPGEFATIQQAIDAAVDGDEVVIAKGEYFENINLLGKAITVRSTDPTSPKTILETIINGGGVGTVVTCNSGEGSGTLLSGLLITNGFNELGGGGMLIDNGGSPTVTNCAFSNNVTEGYGGGMFNANGSHPAVVNCTFSANIGYFGGGMANVDSSPIVVDCNLRENSADGLFASGGGMYNFDSSPEVTHCIFSGNSGFSGGGMTTYGNYSPFLTRCTISGNAAALDGGGLKSTGIDVFLKDTVVCRNTPDQYTDGYADSGGTAISDDYCVPTPPADPDSDCDVSDVNGDGMVDPLDVGFILSRFGCQE